MFRAGQVFKVKIELSSEVVGFGRAKVLEADNRKVTVAVTRIKGQKKALPRGTRIWFVGNSLDNRFNGLWASEVTGSRMVAGVPALDCKVPRFEAQVQQRRHRRALYRTNVRIDLGEGKELKGATRNISRSGMGVSVPGEVVASFPAGDEIGVILETAARNIELRCRVITARYNWLLHRTEIGFEFQDLKPQTVAELDQVLLFLGSKTRQDGIGELRTSGGLSRWLKTEKDNLGLFEKQSSSFSDLGQEQEQEQEQGLTEEDAQEDLDEELEGDLEGELEEGDFEVTTQAPELEPDQSKKDKDRDMKEEKDG